MVLCNLNATQVPTYLRFPFIERGYRIGGTYRTCLISLFKWHNETINAWTMIVASTISCGLYSWLTITERLHGQHVFPFAFLTLSALIHLPFSIGYHLFLPMSETTYHTWRQADVLFIYVASTMLTFSFGYYVFPLWMNAFLVPTSMCVAYKGYKQMKALLPEQPIERTSHTASIALAIMIYLTPMLYRSFQDALTHGLLNTHAQIATMVVVGSLFMGGMAYTFHIPEMFAPGFFDFIGYSHQIMHLGILVAHVAEYMFLIDVAKI